MALKYFSCFDSQVVKTRARIWENEKQTVGNEQIV